MADRHTGRHRTVRVDDELWDAASRIAEARSPAADKRGALSSEIRRLLKSYVQNNRHLLPSDHDAPTPDPS